MLPVQLKPKNDPELQSKLIVEIPNVLNDVQIEQLRLYTQSEYSGLHRRGSKDINTNASFYTCQVHPLDHEIYNILDPIWSIYKHELQFIEPYEIKSYVEGDLFSYHNDTYLNLDQHVARKLNLIIQMSDDNEYEGGDLELILGADKDTIKMPRKKGKLIMFPSYIIHQVTPVTKGQRHSLVGWITGKPFV